MLRHKLFHRAKKVPVSEQELRKKIKKKEKKSTEKEEKKKKEDETAESSHAEGRDTEEKKLNSVLLHFIAISPVALQFNLFLCNKML